MWRHHLLLWHWYPWALSKALWTYSIHVKGLTALGPWRSLHWNGWTAKGKYWWGWFQKGRLNKDWISMVSCFGCHVWAFKLSDIGYHVALALFFSLYLYLYLPIPLYITLSIASLSPSLSFSLSLSLSLAWVPLPMERGRAKENRLQWLGFRNEKMFALCSSEGLFGEQYLTIESLIGKNSCPQGLPLLH